MKTKKELRISYLNGVKGAMDDIENNPSSSEDEVIANRSSHKSLERESLTSSSGNSSKDSSKRSKSQIVEINENIQRLRRLVMN